jgi:serine/threonine-protein kinase
MLVGQQLGPFLIERELGAGAMGTVYKATYVKNGAPVAIKMVAIGIAGNESALARFEREANILKQLDHPNIVRLYGVGRYQKTPYIAMEFVEGETLESQLERRVRHSWEEVCTIGKQICAALAHAHDKGIIHRDLKPANLMITHDGVVKLMDFGIAKDVDVTALTGANSTIGTAAYMSPEQCRGERNLTPKSDLYSLGIVFYELLTGRKPFVADSPIDMFLMHVEGEFVRPAKLVPETPRWLDTLICQMMEKKPEQRPLDARMVAKALDEVLEKSLKRQSAAEVAAKARVIDKQKGVISGDIDAADREAARALRGGKPGKRTSKRPPAFYTQGWFVVVAGVLLLLAAGGLIAIVTRPPAPETLYERVRAIMTAKDSDTPPDYDRAQTLISTYLTHYGSQDNEQTQQMRQWDRQIEADTRIRQLHTRYNKGLGMGSLPEGGELARLALVAEDDGNLASARERWTELREKSKDNPDRDVRIWAWVAESKLKLLENALTLAERLRQEVKDDVRSGKQRDRKTDVERRSVEAMRYDVLGDGWTARELWKALAEEYRQNLPERVWLLLAASRYRDTKTNYPPGESEQANQRAFLTEKLAAIDALARTGGQPAAAAALCREIAALYENHPIKALRPVAAEARKLQESLPQ